MHIDPALAPLLKEILWPIVFVSFVIYLHCIGALKNLSQRVQKISAYGAETTFYEEKGKEQKALVGTLASEPLGSSGVSKGDSVLDSGAKYVVELSKAVEVSVTKEEEVEIPETPTIRALSGVISDPGQLREIALLQEAQRLKRFGLIYTSLTREQMHVLKILNIGPLPMRAVEDINENMAGFFSRWKRPDNFEENWLGFMISSGLVKQTNGYVMMTETGKQFLKFLVDENYPLDKN